MALYFFNYTDHISNNKFVYLKHTEKPQLEPGPLSFKMISVSQIETVPGGRTVMNL